MINHKIPYDTTSTLFGRFQCSTTRYFACVQQCVLVARQVPNHINSLGIWCTHTSNKYKLTTDRRAQLNMSSFLKNYPMVINMKTLYIYIVKNVRFFRCSAAAKYFAAKILYPQLIFAAALLNFAAILLSTEDDPRIFIHAVQFVNYLLLHLTLCYYAMG